MDDESNIRNDGSKTAEKQNKTDEYWKSLKEQNRKILYRNKAVSTKIRHFQC